MNSLNLILNTLPLISIVFFFTFYAITAFSQIHNQLGLPERAKARMGKGRINQIKYSPDGKYLAVATSIGIWLYDVDTSQAIDLLTGHEAPVTSIAFSSDGQTLASGCEDNIIIIWDTETRKIRTRCVGCKRDLNLLAFSPSGETIASTSEHWNIRIWETRTGELKRTINQTDNTEISAMVFAPPDEDILIIFGNCDRNTSYLEYWDTGTGEPIRDILIETNITEAAFSPDNKILAVTGENPIPLQFWDVNTGKHLRSPEKQDVGYEYIAFSPDGSRLVTGGTWEYVSLWDVNTVDQLFNIAHGEPVNSVAYAPDGNTIVIGIDDGTIQTWDTSTRKLQNTIKGHLDASIFSAAFSSDGNNLTCGANTEVLFWNPHTYEHLKTTVEPRCNVVDIEYSPDGKIFATVGTSMKARLWDGQTGRFLGSFIGNHEKNFYGVNRDKEKLTSVCFSSDGNILATGDTDNQVCLWEICKGELYLIGDCLMTFNEHTDEVNSVAFSPDGRKLASGSNDKTIMIWDVDSQTLLTTLTGHEKEVNNVMFSSDGDTVVSGSADGTLRFWDVATGELTRPPITDAGVVTHLACSPDGRLLANSSKNKKVVHIWDAQSGELLQKFTGHTQIINDVAFSPDGETVASVSSDGTVLLWDMSKL